VGVAGPRGDDVTVRVLHTGSRDRAANMNAFLEFALGVLRECVEKEARL